MLTTEAPMVPPELDSPMPSATIQAIRALKARPRVRTISGGSVGSDGSGEQRPRSHSQSRNRKCIPKKNGGGGKGTWGKLGDQVFAVQGVSDKGDPNYDDFGLGTDPNTVLAVVSYDLSPDDIDELFIPLIRESLESTDTTDVLDMAMKSSLGAQAPYLARLATRMGLERRDGEREVSSCLLADLLGARLLAEADVARAFDALLGDLGDLMLDTPTAPAVLGQFMARAVADDCLPPSYLHKHPLRKGHGAQSDALDKAHSLIAMKGGMVKLDNIWGCGNASRLPLEFAVSKIQQLLEEYISSGDALEAERCLRELAIPHFHHEVVYESVLLAIHGLRRFANTDVMAAMVRLLKHFAAVGVVTGSALRGGFERAYGAVGDWVLDVPRAGHLLSDMATHCHEAGVIDAGTRALVPELRGRKRFLSNNDGGKIKA